MILVDAVAAAPNDAHRAVHVHATRLGSEIGAAAPTAPGPPADAATAALADLGYEPHRAGDDIVLDNCPFHALATRHTTLVCGINVAFVSGLLAGLGCAGLRAELRPRPHGCCACIRTH